MPINTTNETPNTWMRMSNALKSRKDLTSNAKLVYTHMLYKYTFFSRLSKAYHENMQEIGEELGLARKTVNDSIKALEEAKLLSIYKRKLHNTERSVISHSYVVHDLYNLYKPKAPINEESDPF